MTACQRFGRFMRRHGQKVWTALALALWLAGSFAATWFILPALALWGFIGLSTVCAGAAVASLTARKSSS